MTVGALSPSWWMWHGAVVSFAVAWGIGLVWWNTRAEVPGCRGDLAPFVVLEFVGVLALLVLFEGLALASTAVSGSSFAHPPAWVNGLPALVPLAVLAAGVRAVRRWRRALR